MNFIPAQLVGNLPIGEDFQAPAGLTQVSFGNLEVNKTYYVYIYQAAAAENPMAIWLLMGVDSKEGDEVGCWLMRQYEDGEWHDIDLAILNTIPEEQIRNPNQQYGPVAEGERYYKFYKPAQEGGRRRRATRRLRKGRRGTHRARRAARRS